MKKIILSILIMGLLLISIHGNAVENDFFLPNSVTDIIKPKGGMWFNTDRPGHGIDLNMAGDTMFIVWFTYEEDGTPTWYIGANTLSDVSWSADLTAYTWDHETRTTSFETVGSIGMVFDSTTVGNFSWNLGDGKTGNEVFTYYVASTDIPEENFTGHWYPPADSGWGLTVVTQGNIEFEVVYFYDSFGDPVWALGSADIPPSGGQNINTIDLFTYEGFCPNCETITTVLSDAGSITRTFLTATTGKLDTDITLSGDLSGTWNESNVDIALLSDVISVEQLQIEAILGGSANCRKCPLHLATH